VDPLGAPARLRESAFQVLVEPADEASGKINRLAFDAPGLNVLAPTDAVTGPPPATRAAQAKTVHFMFESPGHIVLSPNALRDAKKRAAWSGCPRQADQS